MIKFFRHIRQSLINQNQMGKYLKYAIGEILLVVIGILIALQINIWNENRKSLKQGQALMKELLEEFQFHISSFDFGLERQIEKLERQQHILKTKNLEQLRSDSLLDILGLANIDINITTNTYEKIKNQGIGELCTNDSLNKAINFHLVERILLYNKRIDYYLERNKSRLDYINESKIELSTDLIKGLPTVDEKEIKKSILDFIQAPRSKRLIVLSYYDKISAIEYLIETKKSWIELMNAIHDELSLTDKGLEPLPSFDAYLDYKIQDNK